MKTSVKWAIGLAAAFLVCLTTAIILFFSTIGIGDIKNDILDNKGTILSKSIVQEIDIEEKAGIEDISLIKLDIPFGNVKVEESNDEFVRLYVKGKIYNLSLPKRDLKFDLIKENSTLKFTMSDNWTYFGLGIYFYGDITLQIPKTYNKDLAVKLGSGSVDFSIDNEFNNLKLDVSSGSVNTGNFKCQKSEIKLSSGKINIVNLITDDLYMHVGSGKANIESFECQKSEINLSSGRINIESLIANDLVVRVSSGSLNIKNCEAEMEKSLNVKMNLNSGNIAFKGTFNTLNAQISSGTADIESKELKNNYNVNISSGTLKLKLPESASYKMTGEISSGILKNNKTGKRYAGDFDTEVNGGKYKIEFIISSGYAEIN